MRHLISINDLTDADLRSIVARGTRFAAREHAPPPALAGQVAGIYFRKTSTRTRTAFSSGALRLGAQIVTFGPDDLQTNTGETAADTGRVFARMLDVLVARTAGDPAEMRAWAHGQDRMAVVNAMSADEHPTQALADLVTLNGRFGRIEGLKILYVGEGNNTAAALALALSRFEGVRLELRTPPGYGLAAAIRERALRQAADTGAAVAEHHHMDDLPGDSDVVYTTRWETTGTAKPDPDWRTVFTPFRVTAGLWERSPKAVFMHDLPAHRGDEVTAEVLDGPMSIAFDQAENKMHSAMAALEWCRHGTAPTDGTASRGGSPGR
ncbi:ornithine carbamoyltransferase [Actinomadura sp. KC06]|uniref:ornithine carbamoyltransferase n=1 Tax=Actinomadura sp. KC06 TaxID=2530369 RepID=UPI00104B18FD|nr:ornithine carbamoyltransferase [Actinomadura sp. KC06]TDD32972.1 ornithine carbamoyltransferase [Actinomadura sp. KC06]